MFLKRLILLNWANLPNRAYELGSVNLLSGGSGSGKTTMGDAIQTLMTAAKDSLYQYNPGQNESTQRGKSGKQPRTLASYIMGCDDGSFARLDPSDGYIAGVFHPSHGETAPSFTALIGMRAHIDRTASTKTARHDELLFFILPEVSLEKSDLVLTDEAQETIIRLDKLETHFIQKFGKRGFEKYDKKVAYLRRLYGVFRGGNESVTEQEAVAAARAFSRFMAYKSINNIDEFVSRDVLEAKDLGAVVDDISQQLRTIHGMEKDAKNLKQSISLLEKARIHAELYIKAWLDINTLDYKLAQFKYYCLQQNWLAVKKELTEKEGGYQTTVDEIRLTKKRENELREEQISLEAQRRGIVVLVQKDQLEKEKQVRIDSIGKYFTQLVQQNVTLEENRTNASLIVDKLSNNELRKKIQSCLDADLDELVGMVKSGDDHKSFELGILANVLPDELKENLSDKLEQANIWQHCFQHWFDYWHQGDIGGCLSRRDCLENFTHSAEQQYNELQGRKKKLNIEILRLENRKNIYPSYVTEALMAINQKHPKADANVLCDHIKVMDTEWQSAIEGYLGGARFSIIVDAEYEADAIRLVKSLKSHVKVIQGERSRLDVEKRRQVLDQQSIINILDFSHETARYYLMASYGNVLRVNSAEELRLKRRALTKDGMGAGSYSMWQCVMPDEQLVFGEHARLMALTARQKELELLNEELNQANDEMLMLKQLQNAIDNLQKLEVVEAIQAMIDLHQHIQTLERQLSQLDLGEGEELDKRLNNVKADWRKVSDKVEDLLKYEGKLADQIEKTKANIKKLSDQKDKSQEVVAQHSKSIEEVSEIWPEFDLEEHFNRADHDAHGLDERLAEKEKGSLNGDLNSQERNLVRVLGEHNQACRAGDSIFYRGFEGEYDAKLFERVCNTQRDIKVVHNRLKNNVLVAREIELGKIRKSFDNAFITHFCHTLYSALNSGKQQVDLLNKELKKHYFGADKEQFRFDSKWVPEFKEYSDFFKEVIRNPQLGESSGLFDDIQGFSASALETRDKLKAMFLGGNSEEAQKALKRVADYRNYRHYEIYKDVEGKEPIPLSQYGTGSGGQLETPAYIIRSASITSAYRFSEGANHLRMVLVDEAFSYMDEPRSREIINYLTRSLNLQLIFIMPSNKSGPFMHMVNNQFVFVKCPSLGMRGELKTQVQVDAKVLKREKVEDLWKRHKEMTYQQGEFSFMTLLEATQ